MEKRKKLGLFLAVELVFSFLLVVIAEYIQRQSVGQVCSFLVEKAGVVAFCTCVVFFFVLALSFLVRSAAVGSAVSGGIMFILSCIEFYKYSVSGSHLVVADLGFALSLGEISGFAEIKPEGHIFLAAAVLIAAVAIISLMRFRFRCVSLRGFAGSLLCFAFIGALVSPSGAQSGVYDFLDFDTEPANTAMEQNERFENDGFLGFLSQNATEYIEAGLLPPDGYGAEYIAEISCGNARRESENRPNVVVVMSESFFDLRKVNSYLVGDLAYGEYDLAKKLSSVGSCVLPTFGGYTVRSEFELLFGLPSRSMGNVPSPHKELRDEEQNTIPGIFRENGYRTTYIHSFDGNFYNRDDIYANFGFSEMIFEDSFDPEADMYRKYIGDKAVMEKIKTVLVEDDAPSFVFATTMQNHQPYSDENGKLNELEYYLRGVAESGKALYELLLWAESFSEDTIIVFVGDHMPFFSPQGGVYDLLGISNLPEERLYHQDYLVYSNYKDLSVPDEHISLFYLPHILLSESGVAYGEFTATMLSLSKKTPVYGIARMSDAQNESLDAITYDRLFGERHLN